MLPWLLNVLIGLKVGFCSCTPEVRRLGVARVRPDYRVERVGRLPRIVNESSGLARRTPDGKTVWTHNDGGGRPTLYGVSVSGTLLDSIPLPGLRNVDWEDVAWQDSSRQGGARLFIADVGNNANTRRDLTIYIVDPRQVRLPETVRVRYADQTAFPPARKNFDSEAVFYRNDSLFLLTKNRTGHIVRLYGLPAMAKAVAKAAAKAGVGSYALMPLDSVSIKSMVTGAALSPDGKNLAVLTYGKILFFDLSNRTATRLNRPSGCLRIPRAQTEAITYLTDSDLLITNERGWIYRLSRW